jgi:hypothetical protein
MDAWSCIHGRESSPRKMCADERFRPQSRTRGKEAASERCGASGRHEGPTSVAELGMFEREGYIMDEVPGFSKEMQSLRRQRH